MLKLNRITEYGLMALRYMKNKPAVMPGATTSARELSEKFGLPFEITAKTMQRLRDAGLIASAQGAKGGYSLSCQLEEVSLGRFLELMEGPQSLVRCMELEPDSTDPTHSTPLGGHTGPCEYGNCCQIKTIMTDLNSRFQSFLSGIRLSEFTTPHSVKKPDLFTQSQLNGEAHS